MILDPDAPAAQGSGLFGLQTPTGTGGVVVIPAPFEATVSYGAGAGRGPAAILQASHQVDLFDADVGRPYEHGIELDPVPPWLPELAQRARVAAERCIDAITNGRAADPQDRRVVDEAGARLNAHLQARVTTVLADGRLPVVVGGDHAVSMGGIQACAAFVGSRPLGILHVDAHADLRDRYEGFAWSHASIMRNVVDQVHNARLVQVGIRDFSDGELALIRGQPGRVTTYFDAHIRPARLGGHLPALLDAIVQELPDDVFLSFDIDGLDPTLCPNTGTPVPGGLSFDEVTALLERVARSKKRVVGLDLVEVAPDPALHDDALDASWDGNVAARLLYKMIGFALLSRGDSPPELPRAPGVR